jgi:hypothetical protein
LSPEFSQSTELIFEEVPDNMIGRHPATSLRLLRNLAIETSFPSSNLLKDLNIVDAFPINIVSALSKALNQAGSIKMGQKLTELP